MNINELYNINFNENWLVPDENKVKVMPAGGSYTTPEKLTSLFAQSILLTGLIIRPYKRSSHTP